MQIFFRKITGLNFTNKGLHCRFSYMDIQNLFKALSGEFCLAMDFFWLSKSTSQIHFHNCQCVALPKQ